MNNLTPEQRVNKLGHLVTKHVKTGSGDKREQTRKPLPAPSSGYLTAEKTQRIETALAAVFSDAAGGNVEPNMLAYGNIGFLAESSPDTLDKIVKQCAHGKIENRLWRSELSRRQLHPVGRTGVPEFYINEHERSLVIFPAAISMIQATGDHGNNPGLVQEYTSKIAQRLGSMLRDNDVVSPAPELLKSFVAIGVIRGMHDKRHWRMGHTNAYVYSDFADDAEYFSGHISEIEPLIPELIARGSYDRELVAELLSVDSAPLRVGLL